MKSIPLVLAGLLVVSCSTVHHFSSTSRINDESLRGPASQIRPVGIYVALYEIHNGQLREAIGRGRVEYVQGGFRIARSRGNYTKMLQGVERFELPQPGFVVKTLSLEMFAGNSFNAPEVTAHKIDYAQKDIEQLLKSSPSGIEFAILRNENGQFETFTYPYQDGPFRKYYRSIRESAGPGNSEIDNNQEPPAPGDLIRPDQQRLLTSAHYQELLKKFEQNEYTLSQLEQVIRTQFLWTHDQFIGASAQLRDNQNNDRFELSRKIEFYRTQFEVLGKIALRIGRLSAEEPFERKLKLYRDSTFPLDERNANEIATAFFPDATKLDVAEQEKLYPELSRRNAGTLAVSLAKDLFKNSSERNATAVISYVKNLTGARQQDKFLTEMQESSALNIDDLKLIARAAPVAGNGIFSLYQKYTPDAPVRDVVSLVKSLGQEGNHIFLTLFLEGKQSIVFDDFVSICSASTWYGSQHYLVNYRQKISEKDSGTTVKLAKLLTGAGNHTVLTSYLDSQERVSFAELQALADSSSHYGKEHYLYTYRQKLRENDPRTTAALAGLLSGDRNHNVLNEFFSRQTQISYADMIIVANASKQYGKEHYLYTYRQKLREKDTNTTVALARILSGDRNHIFIKEFFEQQEQVSFADMNAVAAASRQYGKEHYLYTYRQKLREKDPNTTATLARLLSGDRNHNVIKEFFESQTRVSYADMNTVANASNQYGKEHYLYTYRLKITEKDLNTAIALARQLSGDRNHVVIMDYINANPGMSRSDLEQLASASNQYGREHYLRLRR